MGKAIIFLLIGILMISIVTAANYDWLYNPYTAKQDRSLSLNQTGNNMTMNNLIILGKINATKLNGTLECTNLYGGSDADFCLDTTGSGFIIM